MPRAAGPRDQKGPRDGNRRRRDEDKSRDPAEQELQERIVYTSAVSKTVKGGRRRTFRSLVVVGDGKGKVGVALGKASEVPDAIRKGIQDAKKSMVAIPLSGTTIPHQVIGVFGAGKVLLRPASQGTGVIAGGPVRAVLEACGIRDILAKSLGSANSNNTVYATMVALKSLKSPEMVAQLRGKTVEEITK